jgi:hypothetical protein
MMNVHHTISLLLAKKSLGNLDFIFDFSGATDLAEPLLTTFEAIISANM